MCVCVCWVLGLGSQGVALAPLISDMIHSSIWHQKKKKDDIEFK